MAHSTPDASRSGQIPIFQNENHKTAIDLNQTPYGTQVTLGHTGTIFNDNTHKLSTNQFVSKQFQPTGPTTVGGGLTYEHIPSGSIANFGASNTHGFGTDVTAAASANIWRSDSGNTRLDAVGNYGRHFGGPYGTGAPNYVAGLNFNHRF